MPADRDDDLAAAVDDDRDAGAIEPWTHDDLRDRDRQQRNEIDDHGSHLIPPQPIWRRRLASTGRLKFVSSEHYKNVFYRKIDRKPGVSVYPTYDLVKTAVSSNCCAATERARGATDSAASMQPRAPGAIELVQNLDRMSEAQRLARAR